MKFRLGIMGLGCFKREFKGGRSFIISFLLALSLTIAPSVKATDFPGMVTLDSIVNSRVHGDSLGVGKVVFYLKFSVPDTGDGVMAVDFPLVISSPDGATWSQFQGMAIPGTGNYADRFINYVHYWGVDGQGSDTLVWYLGFPDPFTPWITIWQAGTDQIAFQISLTIDDASIGKTICLDSSQFAPSNENWLWVLYDNGDNIFVPPNWGGQYCFTITECCEGKRGNFKGDLSESPNVDDITQYVLYMFSGGPAPLCIAETDVDVNGLVNINDLVKMINWMFNGGPQPPVCP